MHRGGRCEATERRGRVRLVPGLSLKRIRNERERVVALQTHPALGHEDKHGAEGRLGHRQARGLVVVGGLLLVRMSEQAQFEKDLGKYLGL